MTRRMHVSRGPKITSLPTFAHHVNASNQPSRRSRVLLCLLACLSLWFLFVPLHAHATEQATLTAKDVTATLRQYVTQQGPWQPEQIEVVVRSFSPRALPPGPLTVRILRPRTGITPGLHSFLLSVQGSNTRSKKIWVRAEVRLFDDVLVTSRPLAHFEAISSDAVRIERRDISTLTTRAFTRLEDITDQQAARAIQVNEILTPLIVQHPQVIRRGSPITLRYEKAGLRIETSGVAIEGGKIGEPVRAKNSSSGQVLEGILIDNHTVRVYQ